MPYLLNTEDDQRKMLEAIGVESIDQLFDSIPESIRLPRLLDLPPAKNELQLTQHLSELSGKNLHTGNSSCFLGGGSYDHFVPAVVDHIAARGEIYTSYTPYQPEVSQGNLQAMFEYQTLICQLTGLDVSNASLYDGGSSTVEAVLMAIAATRRSDKVVVSTTVHPQYRQSIATYLHNHSTQLVEVAADNGVTDYEELERQIDDKTACVVLQHPNFFGCLEDVQRIVAAAQETGAIVIQVFDPISLGLLRKPGDLGVDIAVAEGQSLGNPMQYGGPYLGILACREQFVRRIPGRIAGQTVSNGDRRCWVLTLQTREQHIRRDKATSNICTNQGLFATRATIYLSLLGPQGLREVAEASTRKAHYAISQLEAGSRVSPAFGDRSFFKEFVVRDSQGEVTELLAEASRQGILAGIPLGQWYPDMADCFLVAVTEKRTPSEIDAWATQIQHSFSVGEPSNA